MKIESSVFEEGGMIPSKYTCDGENVSPPLTWDGVPDEAKSLALINDDPDAPSGDWVHWVVYNLPPTVTGLLENVPAKEILENGAMHGKTDFGRIGYGGPCPPGGTHRYFFKLYALDTMVDMPYGCTKAELLRAIEGHIIAEARLTGKYSRQ